MSSPTNKNMKLQIIDKYAMVMKEFFVLVNKSDVMNELNYPITSIFNGMNVIHRVFEYVLIKMKNVDKAYFYSQKTYFYYLEYIEQIHKSNLSQSLNHIDAIMFVYKKTIFDMHDGEGNQSSNTMNNIMTLNDETLTINEKEWRQMFLKISKLTNTLFHWQNTDYEFLDRMEICNLYLARFLQHIERMDMTNSYLEFIQQKIEINFETYENLLKEILEKKEKKKRTYSDLLPEPEKNECFLMKFYVDEPAFREKFEGGNMKDFVKWLYLPV